MFLLRPFSRILTTAAVQPDHRTAFCRAPTFVENLSMAASSKCYSEKLHWSFFTTFTRRCFDQDSVREDILQIISGPVSKIPVVSKSCR